MEAIIQCLSAFIGCLGFSFVFRVHRNFSFALIGSLGGMLGWIVYLLISPYISHIFACLWAMMVVTFFSEIMARVNKAPATIFIIIGCFPIVPGEGIYRTMVYLINSNHTMFINSLMQTIGTAFALATAILIISTIFKVIETIRLKDYNI